MASNLSYDARLAREKAQRRIRNLQAGIKSGKYRGQLQQEAQQQIKDLRKAMQQTRMKTKTGKTIKSHDAAFRREAVDRLQRLNTNADYAVRGTQTARANKMTQNELNLASTKFALENVFEKMGAYSYSDKAVFYKAVSRYFNPKEEMKVNEQIMSNLGIGDFTSLVNAILDHFEERVSKFREGNLSAGDSNEYERQLRDSDNSQDKKYEKHPDAGITRYIASLSKGEIISIYKEYVSNQISDS